MNKNKILPAKCECLLLREIDAVAEYIMGKRIRF